MPASLHGGASITPHIETQPTFDISDLFIQYLKQLGVEYVFGIPGGSIEPLYNALARSERNGGPKAIVARHETGAAFMAHGYYSNSGKLAVCCATTGPGATNLITGVASAYQNNVPMLVITAQTQLSSFGRGAFQESSDTSVNTLGMFQYCTKYNSLVSHPHQFERKLYAAVMTALQMRAPVHLSLPMDVFRADPVSKEPRYDLLSMVDDSNYFDVEAVDSLSYLLRKRKNIVFVIGDDCVNAIGIISSVAFAVNAKLITTPHGKGLVSPYHPLFRGVIGFSGHRSAEKLLNDDKVDLIVAVGTSLSEWTHRCWDDPLIMKDRLVHIESFAGNFARSPAAVMHVKGDISDIFEKLYEDVPENKTIKIVPVSPQKSTGSENQQQPRRHFLIDDEHKCTDDSTPIKPQRLMYDLAELFPPQTYWLADVGNSFSWTVHYLHPYDRRMYGRRQRENGLFHACFEFAPMGWAIGTAVGVAFARPEIPVVCITGDGSWLMNGQEVTVALQHNLRVVFVVLNDSALGMVKHGQMLSGAESVGCEIPRTDFHALAQAYGVDGYIVESPADMQALDVKRICHQSAPTIIDARIDTTEAPPMGVRLKALRDN